MLKFADQRNAVLQLKITGRKTVVRMEMNLFRNAQYINKSSG